MLLVGVLNIISLALVAYYVSNQTVDALFAMWGNSLAEIPSPSFTVMALQEQLDSINSYYLFLIGSLNIFGILFLGILASKIGLEPTRDAINTQKNFIGHTAHELRTPIAIARTNIETTLLLEESVGKAECIEELQRTLVELDALADIINNLVMLNTLTNLEPAEYHNHDLNPIIEEVVDSLQEFISTKNIDFTVESSPNLIVWSNRNALKQMISNLVGNAINFTPEYGSVTVRAYRLSERYIRFQVIDTGIGIPKEELPYIFKPFYRASATQGREDGGSGLGLSIVRELVRLHMGRIGFQSEVGKGTEVTVDLPILRRRARITVDRHVPENVNMVTFNYSRDRRADDDF